MGLVFNEADHIYMIDGVPVPSVTEICKPLTADIAATAKPWLRDAAAVKGTAIHEICAEIDLQGGVDGIDVPPLYAGYITAYLKFLRDYQIRSWMGVELQIGSKYLGAAGTLDRIGIIDNAFTIVDLKTGTKIDKAILTAQLNAYQSILFHPDCNFNFDANKWRRNVKLLGVQLMKNGKYREHPCGESDFFRILLDLHEERKRIYGK